MSITGNTTFIVEVIQALEDVGFDRARLEMLRNNPEAARAALGAIDEIEDIPTVTWELPEYLSLIRFSNLRRSEDYGYVSSVADKFEIELLLAGLDRLTRYLMWNRVKDHDDRINRSEIGRQLGMSDAQVKKLVEAGFKAVAARLALLEEESVVSEEQDRASSTSLHSLGLNPRTRNCLLRGEVGPVRERKFPCETVADVVALSGDELCSIINFGEVSFNDLVSRLEANGFESPWGKTW